MTYKKASKTEQECEEIYYCTIKKTRQGRLSMHNKILTCTHNKERL